MRYRIERKWLLFHVVMNIHDDLVGVYFFKINAIMICNLLNAAYDLGYAHGVSLRTKNGMLCEN